MSSLDPEIHDERGGAPVADLVARRAREHAWKQFAQAQSVEDYCRSWLAIQCPIIGGVSEALVALQKPGDATLAPAAYFPQPPQGGSRLAAVTERALREGQGILLPAGDHHQLGYPVRIDGELRGVVAMDLEPRPEPALRGAMRDLQWGSGWLEVLLRRHADPQEAARLRLKLALDMVSALLEHEALDEGGVALVTELATRLGCDRAALGVVENGRARIRAVSHSGQFERRANLLGFAAQAMEEAIDQRAPIAWPARGETPLVARAHEQLVREAGGGGAASFPLTSAGRVVGALVLERPAGFEFDAPSLQLCEAVAAVCGPIVALKLAGERNLAAHARDTAREQWLKLTGPRHPGLKLAAGATLLLGTFLVLASGTYRVSADATVEGEVQRALSAPIAGFVREAAKRAGDTVKQGEVIGRFDDRDLKLERVKLTSQQEQHSKQFREAMAQHNRAQAAIVTAQLQQVAAQLALVDEQLSRIDMVAPFAGVIVSGDLSQKLGAPVERGQVLFEIAPLDRFRIALYVDEHEFADVAIGQRGSLAVASIPQQRFAITVSKITAVNSTRDGRNRFRVEATLDDPPGRLRPGMEGVGKVEIDERKLVWIWTHSLVDRARLWLWSALP
jgi:RND family efflux transporter MFP subunit